MDGIICLGEALIDFIPLDADNLTYQKAPGGAPANVAVGVAKLGGKASFIGKVGNDVLGLFLKETLSGYGVRTGALLLTDEARTGVTFVTLDPSGERHFSFYISPSADRFLREEDIDPAIFRSARIFHFGSISLIGEPSKSASLRAVKEASRAGLIISYDPNLRLGLWESEEKARETILETILYVDVLKVSDEELAFLTGCETLEEGVEQLPEVPLLLVTLGADGCFYKFRGRTGRVPGISCTPVDTTGAGDAFVSGMLYSLNESGKQLSELSEVDISDMIRFANVSGGLATIRKGAMTGLPGLKDVKERLKGMLP